MGDGPAGLTVAIIFHRHDWPVTVFESDPSAQSRDQGGTLDLHANEGQLALSKAGLLDAFMRIARHEDEGERVLDAQPAWFYARKSRSYERTTVLRSIGLPCANSFLAHCLART